MIDRFCVYLEAVFTTKLEDITIEGYSLEIGFAGAKFVYFGRGNIVWCVLRGVWIGIEA